MAVNSIFRINLLKSVFLLLFILLGVSTKLYTGIGSEFIHNYLGGIIYVIFWILLFSLFFPKYSPCKLVLWVFLVSSGIEFTQLINNSTLELFRGNIFFRTLFGDTFNPLDFFGYFVGALFGLITIFFVNKKLVNT